MTSEIHFRRDVEAKVGWSWNNAVIKYKLFIQECSSELNEAGVSGEETGLKEIFQRMLETCVFYDPTGNRKRKEATEGLSMGEN